jgi:hypothetical protein
VAAAVLRPEHLDLVELFHCHRWHWKAGRPARELRPNSARDAALYTRVRVVRLAPKYFATTTVRRTSSTQLAKGNGGERCGSRWRRPAAGSGRGAGNTRFLPFATRSGRMPCLRRQWKWTVCLRVCPCMTWLTRTRHLLFRNNFPKQLWRLSEYYVL